MKELYKSAYSIIMLDEENSLMELEYTLETLNMTEAEYKEEVTKYFAMMADYRPKRMLSNLKQMCYAISPELQDWVNHTLVPAMPQTPDARSALVMPDDLFAQVSMEQTVEDSLKVTNTENTNVQDSLRYFADRLEAIAWLLS